MDRVFLDANVLFSAAYKLNARVRALWSCDAVLVTSTYAVVEAQRNLDTDSQREELDRLLTRVKVFHELLKSVQVPSEVQLPAKDQPILQAAIQGEATHLITGDVRHFGPYFNKEIRGVRILRPATYLRDSSATTQRAH